MRFHLFQLFKILFIFGLLTIVTQIGGIIYLLYQPLSIKIKKSYTGWKRVGYRLLSFSVLYFSMVFVFLPPIARQLGRTPLPIFASEKTPLRPLTLWTCLLNRHYVKQELKTLMLRTSSQLQRQYPNMTVQYLDANFPFWDGFPLLPHLSHNDGKKLDIAFFYKNAKTGKSINDSPSFYGYGVYDTPKGKEWNQPSVCRKKGHWQYGIMEKITPQFWKKEWIVDSKKTADFVRLLANHTKIQKIFIEPHLKQRWGLTKLSKIRFHGCHAVRHDDHIHVQI